MSYHTELEHIDDPKILERTFKLKRYRYAEEPNGRVLAPMVLEYWKPPGPNETLYATQYPYFGGNRFAYRKPFTWSCNDYVTNPSYNSKKFGRPGDTGSDFTQTKTGWYNDSAKTYSGRYPVGSTYDMHFSGTIYLNPWSFSHDGIDPTLSVSPPIGDTDISTYGPKLWNVAKPAKPSWNGTQFVYELKDLKAMFDQLFEHVSSIKDIASMYLAIKFGWLNLWSDIKRFIRRVFNLYDRIEFLLKNAGKPVRGSASLQPTSTTDVVYQNSGLIYHGLNMATDNRLGNPKQPDASHKMSCTLTKVQSVWFSGMFIYYWDGPLPSKPEMLLSLLGLKVTPYELWTIMPWSWLMDWFYDVSTFLNTISARVADHQFSTYAYVMGHTIREYQYFGTDGLQNHTVTKKFETKVRRRVNPFGSSTNPDSFTDDQWKILAALGLQRSSFDH